MYLKNKLCFFCDRLLQCLTKCLKTVLNRFFAKVLCLFLILEMIHKLVLIKNNKQTKQNPLKIFRSKDLTVNYRKKKQAMCKVAINFGSLDTKNKEISCDSRLLHAPAYVQSMVHV